MRDWFSNNHESDRADRPQVGDIVRVGTGRKLWRVKAFWSPHVGRTLAQLEPLDGYSHTSVEPDRLTIADRPVDTRPDGVQEATC